MGKPSRIEHIYADIKHVLMTQSMRPGQRVDVEALAKHYGVSPIPIRMLMQRLVGEGILEIAPHEGYILPWITEQRLSDMLHLSQQILASTLANAIMPPPMEEEITPPPAASGNLIADTENLFVSVAALDGNQEWQRIMRNLNDRLRPVRLLNKSKLIDRAVELETMREAWQRGDLQSLNKHIWAYHARRLDLVPRLVALAYTDTAS
jgi:DNA-binding transcriptional regulator YhcF (GntR family)